MTVPVTEKGMFILHLPYEHYGPNLNLRGTAELFDHIPEQGPWKLPKPFDEFKTWPTESYRDLWERECISWIHYLNHVKEGILISHKSITEHTISGDIESLHAIMYFDDRHVIEEKDFQKQTAFVLSAKRAFAALLSEPRQKRLRLEDDDIRATDEDIQNARTLINNFTGPRYLRPLL